MSSSALERGIQLFELGRYEEAITYLNDDLTSWQNKYYKALCLFNLSEYSKAEALANELLSESPDNPYVFYLKAQIQIHQDQSFLALNYIDQAIALNPMEADFFGTKSGILLGEKSYKEALKVANEGLKLDPRNSLCLNLRAKLLTKLKKKEDANETVEFLLQDNPEDSFSHANVGWVALEQGNTEKALHHFKEALKFNPMNDYAREGMSTAIKSKNLVYKWYLKYAFWMSNQSPRNQWIFIIGLYVAYRIGVSVLSGAGFSYLAVPLMIAYVVFALGSWIMEPLSNTILSLDRYGKYLLGKNERMSGAAFGILAISGLVSLILFYALGVDLALLLAVTFFCTLIPLPRAFLQYSKNSRLFGIGYGSLMLAVGLVGPLLLNNYETLGIAVFIMMVAFTWINNIFES